jgi:CheY-like chemotaxis protein
MRKSEKTMLIGSVEGVGQRYDRTARRPSGGKDSGAKPARKPRVLVVEDEIFVAWHLESVLQGLGYAVCGLVPEGEAAVRRTDEVDVDVVVMDINLKGDMDGVEAARRIRQGNDAGIVFVTAYSDPTTRARIEAAIPGAEVLAKPVSPTRLRAAVQRALEGREI